MARVKTTTIFGTETLNFNFFCLVLPIILLIVAFLERDVWLLALAFPAYFVGALMDLIVCFIWRAIRG